jgi:preprotein translocase subunit SecY
MLTLTAGTMFLVWLSQQITARGIGNGIALLLVAGIAAELPRNIAGTLELGRQGVLSSNEMAALVLIVVAVTGFVVGMELARRRLVIDFPARRVGFAARSSHLGLKLNGAGIVPIVLGSWLLLILLTVATLAGGQTDGWLATLTAHLVHGPVRLIVLAVLIVLITFLYVAFVYDPDDMAEKLKRHGGAVTGVAPGEATAAHLDSILSRTTTMGAAYLVLVALLPDILPAITAMPIYFGGASLLILVCATLDIEAQVRAGRRLAPA